MKRWNIKYPRRFDLRSDEDYPRWRDEKLTAYPVNVGELVVELRDMTAMSPTEKNKILEMMERANMCVYTAGAAELVHPPLRVRAINPTAHKARRLLVSVVSDLMPWWIATLIGSDKSPLLVLRN